MLSWSRIWLRIWFVTFLNIDICTYTKGGQIASIKIQTQPRFIDKGEVKAII